MENSVLCRNYSLDLLRVVAMLGVIGLHIFGAIFSGNISQELSLAIRIIYTLSYCSVNLFAMLSGYLYLGKKWKIVSIVNIWFATAFWCLVITVIAIVILPDINIKQIVSYIFPYSVDRLWYITCYTFCFLLIPFMSTVLEKIDKYEIQRMLVVLFILLTIVTTFTVADRFHVVSNGYSGLWLCYMFMWGGYLRKYSVKKMGVNKTVSILIVDAVVMTLSTYAIQTMFGTGISKMLLFYNYSSPFIVINSVLIFLLFVNIIKVNRGELISWMSRVTLGVYIIHAHPFVLDYVLKYENIYYILGDKNWMIYVVISVLLCFLIFFCCGLMEYWRQILFDVLHMDKVERFLAKIIDSIMSWFVEFLNGDEENV